MIRKDDGYMDWSPVVTPIVEFIGKIIQPALLIVTIVGIVYVVFLLVKWLMTVEPKSRKNNRQHFFSAVMSYFLIFFLLYGLKLGMPVLERMVNANSGDVLGTYGSDAMDIIDIDNPVDAAKDNLKEGYAILENKGVIEAMKEAADIGASNVENIIDNAVDNAANLKDDPKKAAKDIVTGAAQDAIDGAVDSAPKLADDALTIGEGTLDAVGDVMKDAAEQ